MMYQILARFYDALVQDEEATNAWVSFIQRHIQGKRVLELACGSGEITIALGKKGYRVDASDISEDMIEIAKQKPGADMVSWSVRDMRKIEGDSGYDAVLCLCDSINYILEEAELQDMFQRIYNMLRAHGTYIMDMHSVDRLAEFSQEFFEDGIIEGCGYQWTIQSVEDRLYHTFAFYDPEGKCTLEQHIQRVYDPVYIMKMLEACGFQVTIYTDFTFSGIVPGEKYFYVCRKGENR